MATTCVVDDGPVFLAVMLGAVAMALVAAVLWLLSEAAWEWAQDPTAATLAWAIDMGARVRRWRERRKWRPTVPATSTRVRRRTSLRWWDRFR
jgi:hypothetical protein